MGELRCGWTGAKAYHSMMALRLIGTRSLIRYAVGSEVASVMMPMMR